MTAEPFARERVLARELASRLGLGPGAVEELARALAAYRAEVQAVGDVAVREPGTLRTPKRGRR